MRYVVLVLGGITVFIGIGHEDDENDFESRIEWH